MSTQPEPEAPEPIEPPAIFRCVRCSAERMYGMGTPERKSAMLLCEGFRRGACSPSRPVHTPHLFVGLA